jgi:hypothetical protein
VLLEGGHIARWRDKYRVWDKKGNPLNRCSVDGFLKIKKYLTPKDGGFIIDKIAISKLRPNTWIRQYFESLQKFL